MAFNINEFKAKGLAYGGARPSLFNVYMAVPPSIGIDNASVDKFRFACRAAELPASRLPETPISYFGRQVKVASPSRIFDDWSVTVYNDEDFSVRSMFEAWSNAMNRHVSNGRDPNINAENYKADLEVMQYGKDQSIIRSYQIVGAFPTLVSSIGLNWDQQNAIEEFSVTFAYDYWIPVVETTDKNAGGTNVYGGLV